MQPKEGNGRADNRGGSQEIYQHPHAVSFLGSGLSLKKVFFSTKKKKSRQANSLADLELQWC